LIVKLSKELDDIEIKKQKKSFHVPKLPAGVDLLPEFKNPQKAILLSSNNKDFDKDNLMERMMVSRYNHAQFNPELHMPQNRSSIITMLNRQ
jgi:hypothetical protein